MDNKTNIIHKDVKTFPKKPNIVDYEQVYRDFSWEKADQEIDYFSDGKTNIAYNIVDRHAKGKRENKVALLYRGKNGEKEQYSFKDLAKKTNKFANVLVQNNVKRGDRVFIFLPTIPERYVSFISVLKTGAIASTMFPAFQEMALLDRLLDSRAKIVITNAALFPRIEKIWKQLPHLEKVIIVERNEKDFPQGRNIISYEREMEKASENFETVHLDVNDASYMLYTSGTTGKPKGIVHTHGDVLQAMMTTKYVLDVQEDDIYWCTADSGWVTGVVYGILGIWALGGTSVISEDRFSPSHWYKIIEEYKVTVWYTAPTAIRMLMGSDVDPKSFDLSSLRFLASVGEPLNPEAIWWGLEKFGIPFHDTWWQTELGGISITNFASVDIKPGSMGKPFPGVIAAVVDSHGEEVSAGAEGDLALKPETVSSLMKQIWGNKEKYDSYFSNNWYISGDRAIKDQDGYFWFVGRADDIINTSGERVGPFEIESALVECPDVVEAGVIGKPDALRGEIIKAFIVLKSEVKGDDELKEKIARFVKEHLAGNEYPREIEFVDKLPKTRSGKIMRRLLKVRELGLPEGDISTLEDY
jgi:acetyl-CoA synthetase